MNLPFRIGRSELKYYFLPEIVQNIRDFIRPYTELDPYSAERENYNYTVRSIYYDTDSFQFYYEKMDGLKIRKKIRVRAYNEYQEDKPAFLEIKRRYNNLIVKERAKVPLIQIDELHESMEKPSNIDTRNNNTNGKLTEPHATRRIYCYV